MSNFTTQFATWRGFMFASFNFSQKMVAPHLFPALGRPRQMALSASRPAYNKKTFSSL